VGSLGRLYKEGHLGQGLQSDFYPLLGQLQRVGLEFSGTFFNPNYCPFLPLLLCYRGGYVLLPSHLSPHGQLILTSVSGLLVLYFPVIFLIPFIPFSKISLFLPMSLLSSRLFCFKFSLSIHQKIHSLRSYYFDV